MLSNNNSQNTTSAIESQSAHIDNNLYVLWLSKPLDAEKSAESALLLADKMDVSISKIMHLLSKKSGPLSKPISKSKALKLQKVLSSVSVDSEVIDYQKARSLLLAAKSNDNMNLTNEEKVVEEATVNVSTEENSLSLESGKAEDNIKLDLDEMVDKINAKAKSATAYTKPKKYAWKRFAVPVLLFLFFALGISYLVSSFMPQINNFTKNIFTSVSAASASPEVKENLNPADLRELPTAELLTLANAGAVSAQYELALKYTDKKDYESAIKWLKLAAGKNNREAQFLLGLFYQYGHGLSQDSTQAFKWYKQAADQGVAEAQYRLGLMYLNGEGTAVDKNRALELLSSAGRQNYGDAILTLDNLNGNTFESTDIFSIAKSASPAQLVTMLEPNQDLNQKDEYGQTPLMYASSSNNSEAVQILINMGADSNIQTEDGWTALMYAARDKPENIKTLLINGANQDLRNNDGKTALDIAKENYPETAEEFFILDEF